MSVFRRFQRSQAGNVALIFAFAAIPLLGAIGVAVDFGTASAARSRLSDAVDAAVLAVGSQPAMSDAAAKTMVEAWVNTQMQGSTFGTWKVDKVSQVDGSVVVEASGNVPTTLTHLLGVDSLPISIRSEAVRTVKKVELALALDNTGSMNSSGKIGALRDAASSLVDTLFATTNAKDNIRIALVPFVTSVNIKATDFKSEWTDTKGLAKYNGANFDKATATKVDHLTLFTKMGVTWKGCVEARAEPYDVDDTPPIVGDYTTQANANTRFVPYLWPDEPDKDPSKKYTYNNSYMSDDVSSASATVDVRQKNAGKYRSGNTAKTDEVAEDTAGPNKSCGQPILDLTNDSAELKKQVKAMAGWNGSGTNIPEGLAWGWRVLSPTEPFTRGVAYDDEDTLKAIVLMTDGQNEVYAPNTNQNRSDYTGIGYLNGYPGAGFSQQSRFGSGTPSVATGVTNLNTKVSTLCAAVKAKGIRIYTITFQLTSTTTQALFRSCATSPDLYFNSPTNDALKQAFEDIAGDINKLRLSK